MWDPFAEFQSETLPNGLTVHAAHWPERPWQAMGFLIHSGAEQDPIGREGVAHFVEHLVSENADVSKKIMCDFFHDSGGMVDLGTTGYPGTSYQLFLPIERSILAKALDIFSSMLVTAQLELQIERERHVIMGEFRQHYPIDFKFELEVH